MTSTIGKVPDITNGYMVNGYGSGNQWLTGIKSALSLDDGEEGTKYAFLSKECRAENVLGASATGNPTIFTKWAAYEYVALQTWDGTYAFRAGVHMFKRKGFSPSSCSPSITKVDYVTPNYLSFEEAFQRISLGKDNIKDLFMHLSWGDGLNLFCPCVYINYPNTDTRPDPKYLQPIMGHVAYYENGRFYMAYVACSMIEGQPDQIEFTIRDTVNVTDLAVRGGRRFTLIRPMMRLICPVWTEEYSRTVTVAGHCSFYTCI